MVGPLKKGPNGFTHLLIAVDKFTKWIEAKPITNIRSEEVVKFFLDIIYRFGVPNCIITDHGTNFTGKKCVFGVPSGQLLRFLVSHRGIKASTKQIRAITEMGPP